MSDTEHNQEEMLEQGQDQLFKLQLRFKKDTILEVSLSGKDCFMELRTYVTELPDLFFHSSFHFQHDGKQINEYNEIEKEFDLASIEQPIKVDVVLNDYDYKSARELIRTVNEFFKNPKALVSQIKMESKANFIKLDFGNLLGKVGSTQKEKKKTLDLSRALSEGLAVYPSLAKDPWHRFYIDEKNMYIQSLEFSGWNPPPLKRKMVGDYFYLKLVTYEKETFYITAFCKGFYLNRTTDQVFDPSASSDPFFSILDLIGSVSPHFKKYQETNLFDSVKVDIRDIPVQEAKSPVRWLQSLDEIDDHCFDAFSAAEDLYSNFKPNSQPFRDWNEEYQSFKKTEAQDFYDQINKGKIHEKIQSDFLEAALEGAKAIVEGRIGELNVSSQQSEKCYIHNNIFYTFCVEEPLGLSQLRGEEAPSTSIMASVDMDNMKLLEAIDGKDVHTVQTALIRYRGFVVTAQSLIQGILYYEETTWTKYGSINDGKTIVAEDDFKKAVKEISAIFHAKDDLAFKDKEEKIHQLTSSVDVKGIKAGDGRKYILDLFRMSPRDLNWEGQDFDALVFRPKLVESFIYQQKLDLSDAIRTRFTAKLSEVKKKQQEILMKMAVERDAIKKAETSEGGEESTPKEEVSKELTDELNKLRVEAQEVHSQMGKEIEEQIKRLNLNDLRFDTSLYSGMESYYEDKGQEEAEREKLRKLAEFARGKMVNNFIEEWSRMAKTFPIDTTSLVQAMHNYGLSSRYLGYILKALDMNTHMKHTLLTQRTIIVRSLSHIFNQVLTSVPYLQLSDTLSHLLNCVLGTEEIQDFLGQKVKNLSNYNAEDADLDGGKKKKKKKQKKVQQVKCDLEPNKYMLYSPSDLFGEMNKISEVRYKHKFVDQKSFCNFIFLRSNTDRMSMLRELSLSIGMCLGFRDFNFAGKNSSGSLELPIKPSDIGQFIPKVKKIEVEFLHTKANYALGAQCISSGKYEQAVDIFNSNLQALLNIYGPCHQSVLEFATTLAALYSTLGKKDQGISIQKSVLKLSEKAYGVDSVQCLQAYTDLARFYYENDVFDRSINCLVSALYLADMIGGCFNVESIRLLEEIQTIYAERKDLKSSLSCAEELEDRYLRVFDKNSPQLAWIYYHLCTLHYANGDQKEALGYAQHRLALISKHYKTSNPAKIEDAKKLVNQVMAADRKNGPSQSTITDEAEALMLKERLHQSRLMNKRK